MEETTHKKPSATYGHNIVMLPPPGFLGHFIPFLELSKKLALQHNLNVTLIIPHDGSSMKPQKSLLQSLPTSISYTFLPPVDTDGLPNDTNAEMLVPIRVIRSLPAIRKTLTSLMESSSTRVSALVIDLFAPCVIDVAKEFGIPAYLFYVIAANDLSLSMEFPKLDESLTSDYKDLPEPIKLPGNLVLLPEDLPDSMKDRKSEVYKWMLELCRKYFLADGIIVNSFLELEADAFKYLEDHRQRVPGIGVPPVYPVGPLIRSGVAVETEVSVVSKCIEWLNEQPRKSVLFVSFGSGGTLSKEQIDELAFGLLNSKQRFLWVVREPQENLTEAYLNTQTSTFRDPLDFLPQGFLEKVKDNGLVIPSWAPQIQVLSHDSTGGFLTHCGWNSILESAVHGVPLIAWPLCFEHKMNAVFLTDGLKVAIRVKGNVEKNGVVERGHISELVKELMEGEMGKEIGKRMTELKNAAANVLSKDGSSTMALNEVVNKWINQ